MTATLAHTVPEAPCRPTPRDWVRPMPLGPLVLRSNLWLAPLAGWTSLAFREGVRALGGVGLAVTEVVSAPALLAGGRRCQDYTATSPEDAPLSVQVNARDPQEARDAARWVEDRGYAVVDFNLGCPVRKIVRKGGGAALGRSAEQTAEVLGAAVQAVEIPVTAKIRLGWDDADLSGPAVAVALESAGVRAVVVHGRTRAQAFAGEVDRAGIAAVVRAVSIPVIANGDILTVEDADRMMRDTGAAGVMIGRGAIEDPWLFARLFGGAVAPDPVAFAAAHFRRLCALRPEVVAARQFRKILYTYVMAAGAPEAFGALAVRVDSAGDVAALLDQWRHLPRGAPRRRLVKTPLRPVDHW